jgi:hypothetical protein
VPVKARRTAPWSSTDRGLTPRSRRGPTASHQARPAGLRIIRRAGLASSRRSRLNSNVRPRIAASVYCLNTARPSGLASQTPPRRAACHKPPRSPCPLWPARFSDESPHFCRHGLVATVASASRDPSSLARLVIALRAHGARKAMLRMRMRMAPCALPSAGRPNPSVNARPNGVALGPRGALVHHAPRGPSATPSVPRYLKR